MSWDSAFGSGLDPSDVTPPVASSVVPTPSGPIAPGDTLSFDLDDLGGVAGFTLFAQGSGPLELAYSGGFVAPYTGTVDSSDPNSWAIGIDRGGGWEATTTVTLVATDLSGNALVVDWLYSASLGLQNLSFEVALSGNDGLPDAWAATALASRVEIAGFAFADGVDRGWDPFEHAWGATPFLFQLDTVDVAEFASSLFVVALEYEPFDLGWGVTAFVTEPVPAEAASYGTDPFEAFEADWANNAFDDELGSSTAATYGGDPREAFEVSWANDAYSPTLGATTAASYDGAAPESVEDFEETYAWKLFHATPSTDTLHVAAHGVSNGDPVRVRSTGRLPQGMNPNATYWAANVTTDSLQLDALPPGVGPVLVSIEDTGFGAHSIARDPSRFWNEVE